MRASRQWRRRVGRASPARVVARIVALAVPTIVVLVPQRGALAQSRDAPSGRLGLREAVAYARGAHPAVEAAQGRVQQARAGVGEARATLLPQLSASAFSLDRSFNRASLGLDLPQAPGSPPPALLVGPFANQDARGAVRLTLLDLGAWGRASASRRGLTASDEDARATGDAVAFGAASAYLVAARAEALLRVREVQLALADTLWRVARAQHAAGTTAALDETRAEVQLAQARAALVGARGQREQATYALLRAMGAPLDRRVDVGDLLRAPAGDDVLVTSVDSLPAMSAVTLGPPTVAPLVALRDDDAALASQALERRAEPRAEEARIAQARIGLRAVRAERLPTLGIGADYGVNGRRFDRERAWTQTVNVYASWNLWDGGRRESRVQEQQALEDQAAARSRDVRDQVSTEARTAGAALRAARDLVDAAREQLRLATQELADARARDRAGLAGTLDVVQAQNSLAAAQVALIDALFTYNSARLSVIHATGRMEEL